MLVKDSDLDCLVPGLPLSRRTFADGSLVAGFAAAVRPAVGHCVIQTSAEGLKAGDVAVRGCDGIQVRAYWVQPLGRGPFPTVLVVPGIFGLHEYIRDTCRRLARQGYQAIAPNVFQRQGDPSIVASMAEIHSGIVSRVPDRQVMEDLDACASWAAANGGDPERLGLTGFCWGGRIAWLYAAHNFRLKAAVAWQGRVAGAPTENSPCHPIDRVAALQAPVLGLYGGRDQGVPLDDVEMLREGLTRAGKQGKLIVYPDAGHAFHADYRPGYRPEYAADGWRRMLRWFRDRGV